MILMHDARRPRSLRAAPTLTLLGCTLLAGCRFQFIAPYDATLDSSMTQVQQSTELFFAQLEAAQGTDAASYEKNRDFYVRTQATLRTVLTRAQAVSKNQRIATDIQGIAQTLERDRAMHERDRTLSPENLTGDRNTLEIEFGAFFRLELALKSGAGGVPGAATAPALKTP